MLSCMLGDVVQIYMCVKSVFAGLAYGALGHW